MTPRAALLALAILPLAGSCNLASIRGSGIPAREERSVGTFERLEVSGGALRIQAQVGTSGPLVITGDDNLVPLVETRLHGDTLCIDTGPHSIAPSEPLVVRIPVRSLRAIEASGAVTILVEGVDAPHFQIALSGASDLTVRGRTHRLEIDSSGASDLRLFDLVAQ